MLETGKTFEWSEGKDNRSPYRSSGLGWNVRLVLPVILIYMVIRFHWVRCKLDSIIKCTTEKSIEFVLTTLPKDINEMYERILMKIIGEREEAANTAEKILIPLLCKGSLCVDKCFFVCYFGFVCPLMTWFLCDDCFVLHISFHCIYLLSSATTGRLKSSSALSKQPVSRYVIANPSIV